MKLIKTVAINILIILLILLACFSVFFANTYNLPVFADDTPDGYNSITSEVEVVSAFNSYVKSRGASIVGDNTVTDEWTYEKIKYTCSQLNITIDELKREMYYKRENGSIIDYYITSLGIDKLNAIFSALMTDYGLSVGDLDVRKRMYDGYIFTDDDGNKCLVFVITAPNYNGEVQYNLTDTDPHSVIIQQGSALKYSRDYLTSISSQERLTVNYNNRAYSATVYPNQSAYNLSGLIAFNTSISNLYDVIYSPQSSSSKVSNVVCNGYLSVFVTEGTNNFYICRYVDNSYYGINAQKTYYNLQLRKITNYTVNATETDISLVSPKIKEPLPVQNTYITNEGDIINNTTNNTINYNPYPDGGGTSTSGGNIGDGNGTTIDLPGIDLHLPDIEWSLGDLSSKFPFSIPFDLLAFFTVLNAEPETPEIHGNLNLAIINYQFDFDLHDFDGLAELLRNLEFVGFCIGLILITRNMLRV